MSRTISGFSFVCKACYYKHLLIDGNPHDKICVPCAKDEKIVKEYDEMDFEPFYGMSSWNLIFNSVKAVAD